MRTKKNCGRTAALAILVAICVSLASAAGAAGKKLRVTQEKETAGIFAGNQPLAEYRRLESPRKPYVSKLYSPAGVQVLRDSPSDHKHHHALMFALAAEKVDFWAEDERGKGVQKPGPVRIHEKAAGRGVRAAGLTQTLDWVDLTSGGSLVAEHRLIEVYQAEDLPATLLTWRSQLEPASGRDSVSLSGSHYFGLGIRFVESMDKGGSFFNAEGLEGESVRGSERLTPVRWAAYAASAEGKSVTVAVFDHPANLRHPSRMFTMSTPFAYLGATLNLWKEPYRLEKGKPLGLRYGVAVWDGRAEPAQVERLHRRWLELIGAK